SGDAETSWYVWLGLHRGLRANQHSERLPRPILLPSVQQIQQLWHGGLSGRVARSQRAGISIRHKRHARGDGHTRADHREGMVSQQPGGKHAYCFGFRAERGWPTLLLESSLELIHRSHLAE